MASEAAIGRRRLEAVRRIEKKLETLSGGQSLNLPTRNRYGNEVLLMVQLERIADFLDSVELEQSLDYNARSVSQLKELAAERGIDLGKAKKKPDIISILEAADKAAEMEAA